MKTRKTPETKPRVKKAGPVILKDKEKTMRRLMDAVGEIIRTKGYEGLGVNKIAKQAQADKKLIYRYFGSPENLIKNYLQEKDYWIIFSEQMNNVAKTDLTSGTGETGAGDLKNFISSLLTNQYQFFENEEEMQKMILREITVKNPLMDCMAQYRDDLANPLLALTDEYFKNSDIKFRGVSALLVAGIYYLVLHSKINNSSFCGIHINEQEGRNEILQSIEKIVELVFEAEKLKAESSKLKTESES